MAVWSRCGVPTLAETSPAHFMTWSSVFGMVEDASLASRLKRMVPRTQILRIGNARDEQGNLKALFSKGVPPTSDADICSPIRGKPTPGSMLRPRCFWTR